MTVFAILILVGLIILWLLLLPLFPKIGEVVMKILNKIIKMDEENNKKEKEK